ncbi:hypothetical protein a10_03073 [Streptomyces acidiscabies]|nr:hypothetical protein a10_03073 [Streptomyces acidiscabies]GAV39806.1 hypothetical protein Saa2_02693 [Streptomyces acidiscabies]
MANARPRPVQTPLITTAYVAPAPQRSTPAGVRLNRLAHRSVG